MLTMASLASPWRDFVFFGPQLDECVGAGQRYMPGLGMIYTKPMALKSI